MFAVVNDITEVAKSPRCGAVKKTLGLLRTVTASGLLTTVDTEGIAGSANDLVSNPWQVPHTTTTDENDGVFLKVVTFTWDVNRDFLAVAQANPSDFSQGRVRLLWGHRTDDEANALFLRASLEHWALGGLALYNAVATNQLVNGWHTNSLEKFLQET